jgi:hypothetical protein
VEPAIGEVGTTIVCAFHRRRHHGVPDQMVVVSEYRDALPDAGASFHKVVEDRKRLKELAPTLML